MEQKVLVTFFGNQVSGNGFFNRIEFLTEGIPLFLSLILVLVGVPGLTV